MKKFFIGLIVVGLLLLGVTFIGFLIIRSWYDTPSSTTSSTPATTVAQEKQNGREKTSFKFSPKGCVTTKIHLGEVDFYPKGGEVEITPLEDVQPSTPAWRDKPGITMPRIPRPPGNYQICGIDAEAWGVDIWN